MAVTAVSVGVSGGLQGGADVFQLRYPGQLQLVAGGGSFPLHPGEPLLLLPEETPHLVHHPELGYEALHAFFLMGVLGRPKRAASRHTGLPGIVIVFWGCAKYLYEDEG